MPYSLAKKSLLKSYSGFDRLILILYSMYFIMKPFYFWSSGLPQVSDLIMGILITIYLFYKKFRVPVYVKNKKFLLTGMYFVFYIILVNMTWVLIFNDLDRFITSSSFYIYNFTIVVFVLALYSDYKEKIIEVTYVAILVSVFLQIFMFFLGGGFIGGRMTAGFNNPNQLGYYALLVASLLIFTSRKTVKSELVVLGIISSLTLAAVSLSKAAIISISGFIIISLFTKNENKIFKRNFIIYFILIAIVTGYIYQTTTFIQNNQLVLSVQNRINSIGNDSDDSLEGRGYYRITEFPEYWIFGAGEGGYKRFGPLGNEFHSTLGNIQVSYGIIGVFLFLRFVFLALKNDNFRSWYIITFILIFGVTHNGIRNTVFWILLALIASQSEFLQFQRKNQKT
ncbi:hypothetical protein RFW18_13960 [Metabacillus idriensis]|uniref:O-antigen ligase family protein n=1 Tax=Metabacillus idriensis TaxID=324768 RepID=UPI002813FB8E|nr:hypothetical protein [Metabacillus idriensis]MDR0138856.1 hypothetical protein [Metabacillus idriensis]